MLITRRRFAAFVPALAASASVPSRGATGQPVRLIVGFAAGGTVDVMARSLADAMRASGHNVVVDNRPGASGRIGTAALLQAPADGNTIMMMPSTNLTLFPHIYRDLRYKLNDLTVIGAPANVQFGLAVGAENGPKSLADFLERARRDPTYGSFGTPGAGSVMQLLGELLAKRGKVALSSIPYKGGAAALNDVVAGLVAATISGIPNLLPMHAAGKIRILAVTSDAPIPLLPNVPTFKSAGFPELTATEYMCVVAKRGVPAPLIASLSDAVSAAAKAPGTHVVMERLGFQPSTVADSTAITRKLVADSARWQLAVHETGFKAAE